MKMEKEYGFERSENVREVVVQEVSIFEAERSDLLSECDDVASAGAYAESRMQDIAKELTDLASNVIDFGTALTLVTRCLIKAARTLEDAGRDACNTAWEVDECVQWLDDLTSESNDTARSLIHLARELIEGT